MASGFEAALDALQGEDNDRRKASESFFEGIFSTDLPTAATALTTIMCNDAVANRRAFAAKMLRQALSLQSHALRKKLASESGALPAGAPFPLRWDGLPAPVREGICAGSLHSLAAETERSVRLQAASLVADLSAVVWTSGAMAQRPEGRGLSDWPALMPQLLGMLGPAASGTVQSSALSAVGQIAESVGEDALLPSAAALGGALQALLTGAADVKIRVESLVACGHMVRVITNSSILQGFSALVPAMVAALNGAFAAGASNEDGAQLALQTMTEMVEAQPAFFRVHLQVVAQAMLGIVAAPTAAGLSDDTKALALEFLVTLAECAGSTVRAVPALSAHIITTCLANMAAVTDDPAWAGRDWQPVTEDEEDADEEDAVNNARTALARLADAIAGKQAWDLFVPCLKPLLASTDWRQRAAALHGLMALAEGVSQYIALEGRVRTVVEVALPLLQDAHPRVREAAVRALETFLEIFSDPTQHQEGLDEEQAELASGMVKGKSGHGAAGAAARARKAQAKALRSIADAAGDVLLPALVASAGRANAPLRVRGLAISALVSFLQTDGDTSIDGDLMKAHEAPLMTVLSDGLADFPRAFYASRNSTVAALGLAAYEVDGFERYYKAVIAALTPIMGEGAPPGAGEKTVVAAAALRAAAMLAAVACMESVPKDISGVEAAQLLNSVVSSMRAGFAAADEDSFPQMCTVITKVARLLGPDFAPYLHVTLPLLTEKASRDVSGHEVTQALLSASDSTPRLVASDAQALLEKEHSINALMGVVEACPAPLLDHIDALAAQVAPGLDDRFPQVRLNTAELLSTLVYVAAADKRGDKSHGARMAATVFYLLVVRLGKEKVEGGGARSGLLEVLGNIANEAAESQKRGYMGPPYSPEDDREGYAPFAMPIDALPALFAEIKKTMEAGLAERVDLVKKLQENPDTDDVDVEELQKRLEAETELNDNMVNLVVREGYCIKVHREAVLPILIASPEALGPYILSFLAKKEEVYAPMRQAALCLVDDAIEHASPSAHALFPTAFPALMDACMEKNTILRHPACYGLGVCAQFAPELTKPHAGALLAAMIRVVTAREARSDTNEACTDNAVSACLKLARFCASALPPAQVEGIMDHVLSYLPLKGDLIEARLVHGWLVEAFAANDPLWLGAGGARAPRMVEALGKVLLAFEKTSEEEEEDTVEEAHLAILKQTTSAIAAAAGQGAATLRAIVANLQNPNLRAPLGRYGFPV